MEGRFVEAIQLKDEAETRLRTLDDRIEGLQSELHSVKSELNLTSASLSQSQKRCEDRNAVLAQVQVCIQTCRNSHSNSMLRLLINNDHGGTYIVITS